MGTVHAREPDPGNQGNKSGSVNLDSINAQVVKVHVEGVTRTKEDLVVSNIRPIFKVKHFEDMVLKAQHVRNSLQGN